jgi:hypothetical protein
MKKYEKGKRKSEGKLKKGRKRKIKKGEVKG